MPQRIDKEIKRKRGLLQPTNDIVFQMLFGRGKENITKAMLEDILKIKIHELDLDKGKELLNDRKENKDGRVDIRAVIDGNIECNIEMQLVKHEKMMERFLYYWAKMYASSLEIGDKYKELRKTISIIIVGEEISQFKEIAKAHTKWQLREEKYQKLILTNYCELHIIELPKAIKEYRNNKKDEVLQWMMFLDNPENLEVEQIMEENKDIKKAKEELDKISRDRALWKMALDAEIVRMDNEQRLEDAEERRNKKAKIETAKKMLEKGIDIATIIEITGLTKKKLRNYSMK